MWRLSAILFLFYIIGNQSFAQSDTLANISSDSTALPLSDSLLMMGWTNEVVTIRTYRLNALIESDFKNIFENETLRENSHASIDQLIGENSSIQIRDYGSGQSASAGIRGMGANHTQVYWGNIALNSNMLGQSDLSLIPAGLFSSVLMSQNAAGNLYGSGGIGGNIILSDVPTLLPQPTWKLVAEQQLSDNLNFSTQLKIEYSDSTKLIQTKFLTTNAFNKFRYVNKLEAGTPVLRAENARFHQHHFMQSFLFRINEKKIITADVWLTDSHRNQAFTSSNQQDRALRIKTSYYFFGKYNFTLAYLDEWLKYSDENVNILSNSRSQRISGRMDVFFKKNDIWGKQLGLTFNRNSAKAPGYTVGAKELDASIFFNNELKINRLKLDILLREEFRQRKLSPFLYTLRLKALQDFPFKLELTHSRNIHYPTFNDRYWQPGGNPDLQAEKAFHWELNLAGNPSIENTESRFLSLNSQISLFHTRLNNRIQWLPTDAGYWAASNVKRVHSSGLEIQLPLKLKLNDFKFEWKNTYALTHTIDRTPNADSFGNQLPYVPLHKWNSTLRMSFLDKISAAYIHNLNGKRFTLSDNSKPLPRYHTGRFLIHWNPQQNLHINLSINNLWNVDYEVIQGYPMPLRYGELGVDWVY